MNANSGGAIFINIARITAKVKAVFTHFIHGFVRARPFTETLHLDLVHILQLIYVHLYLVFAVIHFSIAFLIHFCSLKPRFTANNITRMNPII